MKRQRPVILAAIVAAGVLTGSVAWGLVFRGVYETEQTATRTFVMPEDFSNVRKILVRKDGARQLVTMGGSSEFIDQQWSGGDVELESLKLIGSEWHIDMQGTLTVRTKDDYVGEQVIDLAQHVEIEPDFLHSEVKLTKPAERLRGYAMTSNFDRAAAEGGTGGGSRVELTLTQKILTNAPWFAHGIADRRVRASVERTLANQEAAIRRLIAENIDDVPLLPLR